jgi:hypothetical protein
MTIDKIDKFMTWHSFIFMQEVNRFRLTAPPQMQESSFAVASHDPNGVVSFMLASSS